MSRSSSHVKPKQALQSYLDGLLQEAFADFEEHSVDAFAEAVAQERQADAIAAPLAPPVLEQTERRVILHTLQMPALPVAPSREVVEPIAESQREPSDAAQPETVPAAAVQAAFAARPDWSEQAFECLLFDVAGLTLAVPLVSLGSIYPLQGQELTPLFGQPEWYLGLLPSQSGNLRVLDTACWVLADRYRDSFRDNLRYVISVQGYEWGLAVHQVSRSIRLQPSDVKWRTERTQRPWLAGTVIEHMCALLDVQALAELVAAGGQQR